MASQERRRDFLSVKSVFKCPECTHEVILTSKIIGLRGGGSLGVSLAVGLLATAMLSFILWGSQNGYSPIECFKTLLLFVLFTSPIWWELYQTQKYPVTGTRDENSNDTHHEIDVHSKDPLHKGMSILDGISALKGFFGILIGVALFLGVAALIGWVNFTYFNDSLFG